eukprot:scaffold820_cov227-Pinguiococcus_pyrenoidosus.AAC.4
MATPACGTFTWAWTSAGPWERRCTRQMMGRASDTTRFIQICSSSLRARSFIKYFGYNEAHGDYGHVIVTEHRYTVPGTQESFPVYMLFGHLSKESLHFKYQGKAVKAGDVIGWFGPPSENGGWPEHVHFQLSLVEPSTHDMPGTVSRAQLPDALRTFPDPRLVLGSVYRD